MGPEEHYGDSWDLSQTILEKMDPGLGQQFKDKDQIISKGLLVSSNSPQKTNKQIRFYYYDEFVRSFLGRI
jgi:hypothetical protein